MNKNVEYLWILCWNIWNYFRIIIYYYWNLPFKSNYSRCINRNMVSSKRYFKIGRWVKPIPFLFLVLMLIGISADFDPVHKGHEKLISEARKLADKEGKEVVVYLNKGFSANHAPFFVNFEARRDMALALGADDVKSFEGLHHRLVLSYSVPIRLKQMIDDGVTDYITSASISLDEIKSKAQKFIDEGNFVGMPKSYTNRNT